jgi:two-component system response regulator YesN
LTQTSLAYIHQHFSERITLKQIGELTFFSPIYCDTVFKNDMGVSIIEYVLSLRIENAKEQLLEEELSIKEIAESVGFHDHNYFSRVFKKRVGLTPSDYRQRL